MREASTLCTEVQASVHTQIVRRVGVHHPPKNVVRAKVISFGTQSRMKWMNRMKWMEAEMVHAPLLGPALPLAPGATVTVVTLTPSN